MTPREALLAALVTWTVESDPGSTDEYYDAQFLIETLEALGFTVAPTQDARDAEALRLLREAPGVNSVDAWATGTGDWHVTAFDVKGHSRAGGSAPTIAEAADACRAALETSR